MVARCMLDRERNERGNVVLIAVAAVLVLFFGVTLALHFTQKSHDVLPFDVEKAFPPDKKIVPGEVFATTAYQIMEHELSGGTGWRPNDFLLWGPKVMADNNANRQLGIIQALRESIRVFKDHLTKVSSTEFDSNLVTADTFLRNDAEKFWFPSAESRYSDAVKALKSYVAGLHTDPPKSKPINRRNVELIRLFQAWTDLLGDAHANLYKETESDGSAVPMWRTDDYFYHAQGYCHVMYYLTLATRREYGVDLINRPTIAQLFDEIAASLHEAALMKPLIVLDGSPAGLRANHRRNLDVFVADARQKMYSIREELEK